MSAIFSIGDGYTYATIQAAIDAMTHNQSGQGYQYANTYAKAGGYAETLDYYSSFSNGSATNRIVVQAMVSHGGLRDAGIILNCGSVSVPGGVLIGKYGIFQNFCVKRTTWIPATNSQSVIFAEDTGVVVIANIIYDSDCDAGYSIFGIRSYSPGLQGYLNQIYNIGKTSGAGYGMAISTSGTVSLPVVLANNNCLNCTFVGISIGNKDYINVVNNYLSSYMATGNPNGSFNYNVSPSNISGFGGTGNLSSKPAANQFLNATAGAEDCHLKFMSDCRRYGQDMSAYFTTDCVGKKWWRWDTGAFQPDHTQEFMNSKMAVDDLGNVAYSGTSVKTSAAAGVVEHAPANPTIVNNTAYAIDCVDKCGWFWIVVGDNTEWAYVRFASNGTPTLVAGSTNVSTTKDSANKVNFYQTDGQLYCQNLLGADKKTLIDMYRYTPWVE